MEWKPMSLSRNSRLLTLFCFMVAVNALGARPRVLVVAEAIVPPFAEHWSEEHYDAKVRADLERITLEIFSDQFRYLEWVHEGAAAGTVRVSLVENDASPLRRGARP